MTNIGHRRFPASPRRRQIIGAPFIAGSAGFGNFDADTRSTAMPKELRKALDDDGNEVELSKIYESQIVPTADGPIEYKLRPHWFDPDGEQLTADGEGGFRSALGKR